MSFLDVLQQSVLFPELSLERGRAMTHYRPGRCIARPRQRETATIRNPPGFNAPHTAVI